MSTSLMGQVKQELITLAQLAGQCDVLGLSVHLKAVPPEVRRFLSALQGTSAISVLEFLDLAREGFSDYADEERTALAEGKNYG
jgi:hypothetical protein